MDTLGDDFFDFEPTRAELVGRRTGRRIRLGDPVDVEVINASIARRQVELRLVSHAEIGRNGESRRERKPRRTPPGRPPRRQRDGERRDGRRKRDRSERPRKKRRR
jgi:ribonuclease R